MIDFSKIASTAEEIEIIQDSNFNAISKKTAWKKQLKKSTRDDTFANIVKEAGGLPQPNECLLIKSNGLSDTGSIFIEIAKEGVNELWLSTWIISRQNVEMICKNIDSGNIEQVNFVASKRLKELTKSVYAYLVENFKMRKAIKFRVCNCHAKTFSVKTKAGNYYTVTGSGNWTENPRIENYIITNDIDIYKFNVDWMKEVLNG